MKNLSPAEKIFFFLLGASAGVKMLYMILHTRSTLSGQPGLYVLFQAGNQLIAGGQQGPILLVGLLFLTLLVINAGLGNHGFHRLSIQRIVAVSYTHLR